MSNLQNLHSHSTRFQDNNCLVSPLYFRARCFGSFLHHSIKIWNELPPHLRNIESLERFKPTLERYLLDKLVKE